MPFLLLFSVCGSAALRKEASEHEEELNRHENALAQVRRALTPREGTTVGEALSKVELPVEGGHTAELAVAHGVDPAGNYLFLLKTLAEAIRNKDYPQARRIVNNALPPTLKRLQNPLTEIKEKLAAVLRRLKGQAPLTPAGLVRTYEPLTTERTSKFFRLTKEQYATPVGQILGQADQLLVDGKLDEAFELYLKVQKAMDDFGDHSLFPEVAERLSLRGQTMTAAGRQTSGRAARLDVATKMREPIDPKLREAIPNPRPLRDGNRSLKYHELVFNKVAYFFKSLRGDELLDEGLTESVVSRVGIKLEMNVVALEVTKLTDGATDLANEPLTTGILSRFIEGRRAVVDLTLPELMAVKNEYAALRVFRLWVGDPDGHLANYVIGPDGRLYAIDFGKAQISGSRQIKLPLRGQSAGWVAGGENGTEAIYLQECMNTFREIGEGLEEVTRQGLREHSLTAPYTWGNQFDEFLGYAEMDKTVQKIKGLCDHPTALQEVVTDGYRLAGRNIKDKEVIKAIKDTVDTLKARSKALKKVLENRYLKGPGPTSFLFPSPQRWRSPAREWDITLAA